MTYGTPEFAENTGKKEGPLLWVASFGIPLVTMLGLIIAVNSGLIVGNVVEPNRFGDRVTNQRIAVQLDVLVNALSTIFK